MVKKEIDLYKLAFREDVQDQRPGQALQQWQLNI
jgi:hypothetical protein